MRILTVVGARPQFIKAGPVSAVLREHHQEILVHTGQHYDDSMSALFFRELGLPAPEHNLGVGSGPHGRQTGAMMAALEEVASAVAPDLVLVYGDTNSTLAGALVAAKLKIPIAHVEAGLRSGDRGMPEEINRVIVDHLSTLLFCPGAAAVANLRQEGISRGVTVVGDVMYDAFLQRREAALRGSDALARLGLKEDCFGLVTLHRAETVDDPSRLLGILGVLDGSQLPLIFPVHPRTRAAIDRAGWSPTGSLRLTEPVGYLDMVRLESAAQLVVTDSGGVQKEAYFAARPCITVRDTTEWSETLEAGWNVLVGADLAALVRALASFRPVGKPPPLYGDGNAAGLIVEAIDSIEQVR